MNGWIILGHYYVRPIDWEELHVIEPEGVGYVVVRYHTVSDERVVIGTAPTPAAAARLIDGTRRIAVGGAHDPQERRRQAGLI